MNKIAGKEDIMQNVYEKLISCYESIREKIPFTPRVALVLGSGLGDYAEKIRVEAELDYHEIDGFPVSTVPGHAGKFIFGWIGSVPVVCMKGRVHFYEGYPVSDVVLPIRLMKRMGAELFVSDKCLRRDQSVVFCRGSDAADGSHFSVCTQSSDRAEF